MKQNIIHILYGFYTFIFYLTSFHEDFSYLPLPYQQQPASPIWAAIFAFSGSDWREQ